MLIQAKRESNVFPSNLPKIVTRIGGPFEDVTQIWIDHGKPKGSNKSMEVIQLFFGNPSKIKRNSTPQGMGKKRTKKK